MQHFSITLLPSDFQYMILRKYLLQNQMTSLLTIQTKAKTLWHIFSCFGIVLLAQNHGLKIGYMHVELYTQTC